MIEFPVMDSLFRKTGLALLLCCGPVAASAAEPLQQLEADLQQAKRGMLELEERVRSLGGSGAAVLEGVTIYLTVEEELRFQPERALLRVDGERVSETIFRARQRDALRGGGAARLYSGELLQGRHRLELTIAGTSGNGGREEYRKQWRLSQQPGRSSVVWLHLDNATFSQAPTIDMRVVE